MPFVMLQGSHPKHNHLLTLADLLTSLNALNPKPSSSPKLLACGRVDIHPIRVPPIGGWVGAGLYGRFLNSGSLAGGS